MPNPTPKFENLKPFGRADCTNEVLSQQAIAVKLPLEIDQRIRELPNKAAWLRRVIVEAAKRELMDYS